MTEKEMFEKSFQRPSNFFTLSEIEQYQIDSSLGILDWQGDDLSHEYLLRFQAHYSSKKTTKNTP